MTHGEYIEEYDRQKPPDTLARAHTEQHVVANILEYMERRNINTVWALSKTQA